ncbi:Hypothetical predicted protein [Lecanosticta acicola]|uniref:Uncharacterized protein n=1 Tax=Lecanosticta acicola TaxID=111012 RepID=A0AAI8Z528_9PEZI|nr:Hypothetical predicted protein [Lecanosticta acicola]
MDGEADEDYTAGPCRMISAFDGVQEVTALLMKLDLSAKIQEAINFQRGVAKEKRREEK